MSKVAGREPNGPATAVLPTSRVSIRAVASGDEDRLRRMFSRLSGDAIYRRFHLPYPRVPEWMSSYLADEERFGGRSLVAAVGDEVVGHAMYAVQENDREAEMAIVVEDRWQARGVGTRLLYRLAADARSRGIEVFDYEILGENRAALRLISAVFATFGAEHGGGYCTVSAPLQAVRPVRSVSGDGTAWGGVA